MEKENDSASQGLDQIKPNDRDQLTADPRRKKSLEDSEEERIP